MKQQNGRDTEKKTANVQIPRTVGVMWACQPLFYTDYGCNCLGCTRTSHRGDMLVILFRLLALCLTAPEKWKNFTGSPFGFLFHNSGYRESFLQVPKAHVSVRTLLIKHVWLTQRLLCACGWQECPNSPGLFMSEAMRHYTWNLTPKQWIRRSEGLVVHSNGKMLFL